LTDDEHPCQMLADLQTIQERLGGWARQTRLLPRRWRLQRGALLDLGLGSPRLRTRHRRSEGLPAAGELHAQRAVETIRVVDDPAEAVKGCDVLYTDVWVSMGKEAESADRIETLKPWQINDALLKHANPGAIVMHCLPAYRGKEITDEVMEAHADVIFDQAENRLHAQKAVIVEITRK
jgi:ornithine carbamoyltransferase